MTGIPIHAARSDILGSKARIPRHQSVEKVRRPTSLNQRTSVLSAPFRCRPALETAPEKVESSRKRLATMRVHSAALALAIFASVTASSNVLDCTASSSDPLDASNSTTRTWTCKGVAGTRQIYFISQMGQTVKQPERRVKRQETSTGNSDGAGSSTETTAASTSDSAAPTTTTTTQAAQTTTTTQSPAAPTTTPAQTSSSPVQSPTTTSSPPAQQSTTAQPTTTTSQPDQDQATTTSPASATTTSEGASGFRIPCRAEKHADFPSLAPFK